MPHWVTFPGLDDWIDYDALPDCQHLVTFPGLDDWIDYDALPDCQHLVTSNRIATQGTRKALLSSKCKIFPRRMCSGVGQLRLVLSRNK